MLSIIFSSLEHQKKLLAQGVTLEGQDEKFSQKMAEIISSAMYVYFDYTEGLQIKKDTAILNESTLRQLDQILAQNLDKIDLTDIDEGFEE